MDGGVAHAADRSAQLSNYPTSLLSTAPQDLETTLTFTLPAPVAKSPDVVAKSDEAATKPVKSATVSVAPAMPQVAEAEVAAVPPPLVLKANQQAPPRSRFTELMTEKHLSFWFLLTAAFIAAGLGALHALEPGHGKTIVAAYLVGSRGTARHAVALGALVTASHTAGVYMLGAVVLYASAYIVPERIYPWLSVVSGLTIAVLACYMLLRAWTGADGDHSHEAGRAHRDWMPGMRATETKLSTVEEKNISLKQMLTLGITGGIIPCPAALVVLLSAVALHRIAFGLFLIVSFSLGLAAVLIAIGLMMVRAQRFFAKFSGEGAWARRYLPMLSSSVMLVAGLAISASAFFGAVPLFNLTEVFHNRAGSLAAIVLLGLFLGMRHSTDPDHVVAVSTIVTRERSVKQGALIGMLWGFGHTITIFLVGAGIILFNLVIPPRVGLSMEFSVAVMLVLLGVLNLTGTLQKFTKKMTPAAWLDPATNVAESGPLTACGAREAAGLVPCVAAPIYWAGAWARGLRGRGAGGAFHDPQHGVGRDVSAGLRIWDRAGDDAHDHRHGSAAGADRQECQRIPDDCVGAGERVLRPVPDVPPWVCRWTVPVHRALDARVIDHRSNIGSGKGVLRFTESS